MSLPRGQAKRQEEQNCNMGHLNCLSHKHSMIKSHNECINIKQTVLIGFVLLDRYASLLLTFLAIACLHLNSFFLRIA